MPYSKIKESVAKILVQGDTLLTSRTRRSASVGQTLIVDPGYGPNRERSIAGRTPREQKARSSGLREEHGHAGRSSVDLGIAIISTSSGLLTDRQGCQERRGWEVLAYVWSGESWPHWTFAGRVPTGVKIEIKGRRTSRLPSLRAAL